MTSLESAVQGILEAYSPIIGTQHEQSLLAALNNAAAAGWARGAATAQARIDQELAILRAELKSVQTELAYAKAG